MQYVLIRCPCVQWCIACALCAAKCAHCRTQITLSYSGHERPTIQKQAKATMDDRPSTARAMDARVQKAQKSRVAEGSCQVMQEYNLSSCVATSSSRFCSVKATASSLLYLRRSDTTAFVLPSSCTACTACFQVQKQKRSSRHVLKCGVYSMQSTF